MLLLCTAKSGHYEDITQGAAKDATVKLTKSQARTHALNLAHRMYTQSLCDHAVWQEGETPDSGKATKKTGQGMGQLHRSCRSGEIHLHPERLAADGHRLVRASGPILGLGEPNGNQECERQHAHAAEGEPQSEIRVPG